VVGEHLCGHDVGQSSFEGADGLHGRLAGGLLGIEVGPPFGGVAQLDGRHDVQRWVDPSVTGAGEPGAFLLSRGGVHRCRAGSGGERVAVGESVDVADVDE
jgi:hypothetical protein